MMNLTSEKIEKLEEILKEFRSEEDILKRKAIIYKSHEKCLTENMKKMFIIDYEIDLYKEIRQEKFLRDEYLKEKLYKS